MSNPKTGPGRPRAFEHAATLTAAMRLFWSNGYAGTSVPDLTSATGLSSSSLYNAFGSKTALLAAALAHYHETVLDRRMLGPMLRGTAGLADLEAFLGRLAEATGIDPPRGCLAVNTIAELRDPEPAVAAQTERYRAALHDSLHATLTRAAALGEIPAAGVDARTRTLVSLVLGYNLLVSARAPADEALALLDCARTTAAAP
jgi:TetR/AcrR family transcriptional regulator, transcriptional repressor for nem operon